MAGSSNVLDEARALVEKRLAELDEERKRLGSLVKGWGKDRRRSSARDRTRRQAPQETLF